MSMITGCPACGTKFRVVPDQLKISDGWVRCGHCSEVFDASAHLEEDRPGAAKDSAGSSAVSPAVPAAMDIPGGEGATVPPDPAADPLAGASLMLPAATAPASGLGPDASGFNLPVPVVAAPDGLATAAAVDADSGYTLDFSREVVDPVPASGDDPVLPAAAGVQSPLDEPGFVRQARRRDFWRRPLIRCALAVLALALLFSLLVQVALQERDRLASAQPQLRPLLVQLCGSFNCTVQAPRRIDALLIDSSGFARLRPDAYRLSFSIRNQASLPVALPALELTLTDTQDQPVLRRVLQPAELGASTDILAPGSEWSAAAALAVGGGNASRVAGYRLLAFYP